MSLISYLKTLEPTYFNHYEKVYSFFNHDISILDIVVREKLFNKNKFFTFLQVIAQSPFDILSNPFLKNWDKKTKIKYIEYLMAIGILQKCNPLVKNSKSKRTPIYFFSNTAIPLKLTNKQSITLANKKTLLEDLFKIDCYNKICYCIPDSQIYHFQNYYGSKIDYIVKEDNHVFCFNLLFNSYDILSLKNKIKQLLKFQKECPIANLYIIVTTTPNYKIPEGITLLNM